MDPSIEIHLARPNESLTLGQMSRDLIESGLNWTWKPSRILAMIQHPETVVLVAKTRVEIIGFAIMEFHEVHAHLNLLAVKPARRRGGVGKALVAWLEASPGLRASLPYTWSCAPTMTPRGSSTVPSATSRANWSRAITRGARMH